MQHTTPSTRPSEAIPNAIILLSVKTRDAEWRSQATTELDHIAQFLAEGRDRLAVTSDARTQQHIRTLLSSLEQAQRQLQAALVGEADDWTSAPAPSPSIVAPNSSGQMRWLAPLVIGSGVLLFVLIGAFLFASRWNRAQQVAALLPAPTSPAPTQRPTIAPMLTSQPQPRQVASVGQTYEGGGYKFTLVSMDVSDTDFGDMVKAKEGHRLIAVDVLIESTARSGVHSALTHATIKDDQGYSYNATLLGKQPILAAKFDVPAGTKERGWITFQVPASAAGLHFFYDVSFVNDDVFDYDLGI